jgi:hypothetical protein
MVRKDLERVGIPYENEDGIADFHAAGRHSQITELFRNGASLRETKVALVAGAEGQRKAGIACSAPKRVCAAKALHFFAALRDTP